jgi:acetyl esterase/lipase
MWTTGDKELRFPPFLYYLALKGYVIVCVNHTLTQPYPSHLINIKKAIRWTRKNIKKYSGDPSCISIAGSNSGAHLAVMAALTQNDPQYQPEFESEDTTLTACVSLNGCYDVSPDKRSRALSKWFLSKIMKITGGIDAHEQVLKQASPIQILKANCPSDPNAKIDESFKLKSELPPIIVFQYFNQITNNSGKCDTYFPIRSAREFMHYYKKASKDGTEVCMIEFENANNLYDRISCPRAHYLAYGVVRFLSFVRRDEKKTN